MRVRERIEMICVFFSVAGVHTFERIYAIHEMELVRLAMSLSSSSLLYLNVASSLTFSLSMCMCVCVSFSSTKCIYSHSHLVIFHIFQLFISFFLFFSIPFQFLIAFSVNRFAFVLVQFWLNSFFVLFTRANNNAKTTVQLMANMDTYLLVKCVLQCSFSVKISIFKCALTHTFCSHNKNNKFIFVFLL